MSSATSDAASDAASPKFVFYFGPISEQDLAVMAVMLKDPNLEFLFVAHKDAVRTILPWYLEGHKGVTEQEFFKLIFLDAKETLHQLRFKLDLPCQWVENHRKYHFDC